MYTDVANIMTNYMPMIDTAPLVASGMNMTNAVTAYLPIAQRILNQQLGQTLEQESLVDMRMDGPGTWNIALPHMPIQTLTKLEIVFGAHRLIYQFANIRHLASKFLPAPFNQEDNTTPGDCFVNRDAGLVHIDLTGSLLSLASAPGTYPIWNVTFTSGQRNIIASYTHGFPAGYIPLEIQDALAKLVTLHFFEMSVARLTGGASMVQIGSVRRQWGNKKGASLTDQWKEDIEAAVNDWRCRPLGGLL